VYAVRTLGTATGASEAGAETGEAQLESSSDEISPAGPFEPGPNPTEIYLTTTGATGGPDSFSSLLLPAATTSVIVVDASGVWINGVHTALATRTTLTDEMTTEAQVERRDGPAAPANDAPPGGPPVCTTTGAASPAPGSTGSGVNAALAARASPISSDDGEIQDPPTFLEPPGAVVTLLDTPG
jgi:hypothetical protein